MKKTKCIDMISKKDFNDWYYKGDGFFPTPEMCYDKIAESVLDETKYKEAFALIEELCRKYKTSVSIKYSVNEIVSKNSRKWIINTMDKKIVSEDLIEAISESFKVILGANGMQI